MCRWLAYAGSPIRIEDLLTRPSHSLVDQSFEARQLYLPGAPMTSMFRNHAWPTNGDGFGVGWWGDRSFPGQYRDVGPAWSDANLHRLAEQVSSPMFLAHVRAALGGTIDRANCHPFQYGRWLFQYNGEIGDFFRLKRDLTLDVAPELYPFIEGNADTELCFYLALTYGLDTDPKGALARLVGRVEQARTDNGVDAPFSATICAANGEEIYAVRYSSNRASNSLYHSVGTMRLTAGDRGGDIELPADGRIVVSEPLELEYRDTKWVEIPEWSIVTVRSGVEPTIEPFTPTVLPHEHAS
ncbi:MULTISPECIES: class II glutamine amidotransferase [unclassified Gordonia (in: high G+C Gram-positive bacteria)]|uniref:class II glutamine amidotransferase n=1 Tax=unclassified Gordonia (in: high G+C Gram-positive bacteria) TaxID=2657482 RepID=UPI0007EBD073|nr:MULTISPECIES: class II glutamine amidotransferase [unclassified Gordonia (in: high G+C Gram-positive bacteria)]OBC09739.1 class II glutamine amidotransferase [Gordonia sp. 852002-50395_SCH5434458]OBC11833.1 class II glutamine amidotransferase [Gordonia sp. 852002-50816_SCH5313054-a]OBC21626.1 class II glutamine amidotransferase [Gordonia sp. 852002-50816_SCH5313054-c]